MTRTHKRSCAVIRWLAKQLTFTKILLVFLTWKCVGWIDQSYALAWADKTEIAESLSREVMIGGIAVLIGYLARSLFEHLSENNNWPDKATTQTESESSEGGI